MSSSTSSTWDSEHLHAAVSAASIHRFFLRDLEAFAAILACALACVGAIVSYALGHFGWMALAAVACAGLFVLANRLEERRDREERARYDDAAAAAAIRTPRPMRFWAAYGWYAWLGLGLALLTPEAVAQSPLVVKLVDGSPDGSRRSIASPASPTCRTSRASGSRPCGS